MNTADLIPLLPMISIAVASIVIMLVIAFYRSHAITAALAIGGIALALASLPIVTGMVPRMVTPLLLIDHYALVFIGLILLAGLVVATLSYDYLEKHDGHHEEFYLLLLLGLLGCTVLVASAHFASLFLGIEILSVSLYALAAYLRHSDRSVEAGVKYLILAAVSSAFILFGMALVYAELGSMSLSELSPRLAGAGVHQFPFLAGVVFILVGLGFKLAVAPFHLWTPDVYEGAPAPVTAFIATVSKGAVFAVLLRFFSLIDIHTKQPLLLIVTLIAVASMFAGNLLALLQTNVKRILAYSSISHLGYLLVTILAGNNLARHAAAIYLTAYFITTLGAFGVVTVLSSKDRDADHMDDYLGLAWRRPWLAAVFTLMLFSLAGIPLTAGFIGKFFVAAAGVGSALWLVVAILVINSAIGLSYYLRIIVVLFSRTDEVSVLTRLPLMGTGALAILTILLIWLGVFPGPVIGMIRTVMPF